LIFSLLCLLHRRRAPTLPANAVAGTKIGKSIKFELEKKEPTFGGPMLSSLIQSRFQLQTFFVLAFVAALTVGCGKDEKQNSNVVATSGSQQLSNACLNHSQHQGWGSLAGYGFYGYAPHSGGYSYYPNQGFCGCPAGTVPVCDANRGMGCMQTGYYPAQYATWQFNPNQNSWAWFGFHSYGYSSYGSGSLPGTGCFQQVARTCVVDAWGRSTDCGFGSSCLANPGSPFGVCVR